MRFSTIDGFDLSSTRIEHARRSAEESALAGVTHFQVGNFFELDFDTKYDVVIFEDALHHLSPTREALARADAALNQSGLLVVNDYVGPNRLQLDERQQQIAEGLLAALPTRYRRQYRTERVKTRVAIPSRLRMMLKDPSEAAESRSIVSELTRSFEVLEKKDTGGTIISPLLTEIAQNFQEEDPIAQRLLNALLDIEDVLLAAGEISSDYAFVVCRKRGG